MSDGIKRLRWVASSKKDLADMPERVKDVFGYALHLAQSGKRHVAAKALKGFGGAGLLEVVEDFHGDTYRAIYTLQYVDTVYVIHCFQRKSKRGIKTPKKDIELVKARLVALAQTLETQYDQDRRK